MNSVEDEFHITWQLNLGAVCCPQHAVTITTVQRTVTTVRPLTASRKATPLPQLHAAQCTDNAEKEHFSIHWVLQTGEIASAHTHTLSYGHESCKQRFKSVGMKTRNTEGGGQNTREERERQITWFIEFREENIGYSEKYLKHIHGQCGQNAPFFILQQICTLCYTAEVRNTDIYRILNISRSPMIFIAGFTETCVYSPPYSLTRSWKMGCRISATN
jgi:hypothetical protein